MVSERIQRQIHRLLDEAEAAMRQRGIDVDDEPALRHKGLLHT